MIKNLDFKFESELKVSFCFSGSSLHEDHQVYVYVSTFYQLINSHIKRTQWQYRAVKSRNQLSQPKYGWLNWFFCNSTTVRGKIARFGRTEVRFPEKLKCQTFEWKIGNHLEKSGQFWNHPENHLEISGSFWKYWESLKGLLCYTRKNFPDAQKLSG